MPAPGDQHKASLANPFEEPQKRMSEYTAKEIATLQSRLEKQLGPEYISSRSGPSGQKVHYIAAEKCISLANDVFGFNGWSSSIQNLQVDFVDEHPQTMKVSLGLSVIVRVTLRDGTYHEDIGYGHIENCKGKAAAFEKAKKEGTTDGLKRALRNFGNVLGNCIYDKDYLARVTKMKPGPTRFDETRLHRHSDFAKKEEKERAERAEREKENQVKKEMVDSFGLEDLLDADFDEADFAMADEGHPDEVSLPNAGDASSSSTTTATTNPPGHAAQTMQPPARPMGRSVSAGNIGGTRGPQPGNQTQSKPPGALQGQQAQNNRPAPPNQPKQPSNPSAPAGPQQPSKNLDEPLAFFSARAVPQNVGDPNQNQTGENSIAALPMPSGNQVFNPKAESPSIRKTPGIDHNSSKPVGRNGQHVPPASSQQGQSGPSGAGGTGGHGSGFTPVRPSNAANGGASPALAGASGAAAGALGTASSQLGRRIGAPGAPASPLANRGSYRPPTMTKRPVPQDVAAGRPPLAEVMNGTGNGANATSGGSGAPMDTSKRQKMA